MSTRPGLGAGAAGALARRPSAARSRTSPDAPPQTNFVTTLAGELRIQVIDVPLDGRLADDPTNPESRVDPSAQSIEELRNSMKTQGLLQPLVVTQAAVFRASNPDVPLDAQAEWVIRVGHRRRAAGLLAGFSTLPAIVRMDDAGVVERLSVALQENYHRLNFTPLQEARSLATIRDAAGLSQRQLQERTGISQAQISKRLQLLDLAVVAQDAIENGRVTVIDALQHLRRLSPAEQARAVEIASTEDRPIEAVVRQMERPSPEAAAESSPIASGQGGSTPAPQTPAPPTVATPTFQSAGGETTQPARPASSSAETESSSAGRPNADAAGQDGGGDGDGAGEAAEGPRDALDECSAASQARVAACKQVALSTLKPAEVLSLLVDVTLMPPRARPSRALETAAEWLGIELGSSAPEEFAAETSTKGGRQAQRLAVATALARREADIAAMSASRGVWDEATRLHVQRLVDWGAHTLSEYETRKLREPIA